MSDKYVVIRDTAFFSITEFYGTYEDFMKSPLWENFPHKSTFGVSKARWYVDGTKFELTKLVGDAYND